MQRTTSNKFPVSLILTLENPCCSSKPRYSEPLLSFPSVCTSMFKDWSKAVLLFFFSSSNTISASKIPQPNSKTNAYNSTNPLSTRQFLLNCTKGTNSGWQALQKPQSSQVFCLFVFIWYFWWQRSRVEGRTQIICSHTSSSSIFRPMNGTGKTWMRALLTKHALFYLLSLTLAFHVVVVSLCTVEVRTTNSDQNGCSDLTIKCCTRLVFCSDPEDNPFVIPTSTSQTLSKQWRT